MSPPISPDFRESLQKAAMALVSERDAARLSPEQAGALVGILDLYARWDALLAAKSTDPQTLHAKQKANDAVQEARREYIEKYRTTKIPEPGQATPHRVARWCRILRALLKNAEGVNSTDVMVQVYRLTDRLAANREKEPVKERPAKALPALDIVIAWCDALVIHAPLFKPKRGKTA